MGANTTSSPTLDKNPISEQSKNSFAHRQLLFNQGDQKALETSLKSKGFKIKTDPTSKPNTSTDTDADIDVDILIIIPIAHNVYDLAVLAAKVPQFDQQYKQYQQQPLSEGDPLIKAYGLHKALLKTIERYNEILNSGVAEEVKPWLRTRLVRLSEARNEIIGGMTAVLAPFGLGMNLDMV